MGILDGVTQVGRPLKATTPVGADALIPTKLVGYEAVSKPFLFTVDFVAPLVTVTASEILGKPVSLTLDADGDQDRFIHGLVSRWTETGKVGVGSVAVTTYRADLVPWLWMLGLSTDCRTFENKTVREVVEAVFSAKGFADFRWRLTGATPTLEYVVQYQESDLAFVSRLLEEHGLYYAFEYEASKHRLVISNSVGPSVPAGTKPELDYLLFTRPLGTGQPLPGLGAVPGMPTLPNVPGSPPGTAPGAAGGKVLGGIVGSLLGPLGTAAGGTLGSLLGGWVDDLLGEWFGGLTSPPPDRVTEYLREQVVHTKVVAANDFHLLRAADSASQTSAHPGVAGERFEFLGDLAGTASAGDATPVTRRRIEAEEAGHDVVRGSSTAHHVTPGTRIKLKKLPATPGEIEIHVTAVAHVLETGSLFGADRGEMKYFNEFSGVPVATPFLPERTTALPSVRGTQTALVVGAGGAGQIDVDKDGRVLVQFPWDRGAGKNGQSQHRVHLASLWSGVGWGAIQLPRVGQLVLVEFLEGDPDRPIVTGRVYSNNHAHPYTLPANKTQSGIKSRTLGGGADNFNELRFEDKQAEEHVFLQAEKDLTVNVKNDETRTVGHDRVATIQHHDKHVVVGGDGDKAGEQRLTVQKGNQVVEVLEGDQTVQATKGVQLLLVTEGEQTVQIKKGPQAFAVDDGNRTVKVPKGNNTTDISGTDATTADTITLTATTKFELKVGASKITVTPSDITLAVGPSSVKIEAAAVKTAAAMIEQAAQASNKVTGAMVSVEGQAMTAIKGALTQIEGSALLKAGGGVSMIG